ncbi:MAG: DMT family transporter [Deltaproteobacteria bacterium]|nr:DMT family transporter [Deltaproteobacteria bacterium]
MAESFALVASFFFAVSHILVRRGLATSNAITGAFVSLGVAVVNLWLLVFLFLPFQKLQTRAIAYFIVAGIFAPALGRTLGYVGIQRLGVARAVPIVSCSPVFASIVAVLLLRESWPLQNLLGTLLVIIGVAVLATKQVEQKQWRAGDLLYPLLGAVVFGISTNLRKLGLLVENLPLMAAAITATTGFLFISVLLRWVRASGGLMLSRSAAGWFAAAGVCNTGSVLSVFYALSSGKVVVVEPLITTNPILSIVLAAIFLRDIEVITTRVIIGACCTVGGTILILTL